jgi:hypothetical protein
MPQRLEIVSDHTLPADFAVVNLDNHDQHIVMG